MGINLRWTEISWLSMRCDTEKQNYILWEKILFKNQKSFDNWDLSVKSIKEYILLGLQNCILKLLHLKTWRKN
jgi:hypothetical protein